MKVEVILKELEEARERLFELEKSLLAFDDVALERKESLIMRSTIAEKIFKFKLKELGVKFEFQKVIKHNKCFRIVDFYLPDYNLIIEIDGDYHITKEQKEKDYNRTQQLVQLGYNKILRFDNIKAKNISGEDILKLIKQVKPMKTSKTTKQQKLIKYKQRVNQLEQLLVKIRK